MTGNLVLGTGFGTRADDDTRFATSAGKDMGHGGHGYWARGSLMKMNDNIAVGWFQVSAYTFYIHCTNRMSTLVPMVEGVNDGIRGMNLAPCSTPISVSR